MTWLIDALAWISVAGLLGFVGNLLVNGYIVRRPALAPGLPANPPKVSILIPARNEELRLGPCLESLDRQDYVNLEVLVLDDRSEDRTAELARRHGYAEGEGAGRRLLRGRPLPAGWTGKAWACQQLAEAARGDYLLFTDADTLHAPGCVRAAVAHALATRADLLTLWPFQITCTWSEHLVIPLLLVAAGGALPHWLLALALRYRRLAELIGPGRLRSLGAANGQFLLFRRTSYFGCGGHRAVANHLVEDVALGREMAKRTAEGVRLVSANGIDLIQCRMYTSFLELWEGFTKNLHPLFEGNQVAFATSICTQGLLFIWPFLVVWWRPTLPVLTQLAFIYLVRVLAACKYRSSWWGVVFHPIGYGVVLLIALNSYRCAAGKGVVWKGRRYQVTAENAGHV
ncbi:MAG TPA: glycosyltransferase [Chthoniobacterales bacterium]